MAPAVTHREPDDAARLEILKTIFEREFSYVWNALRRLGVRASDLDDLTHDTFLKIHRALPQYDPSRPLRPWLFGVAFRVASDYRRLARHGDVHDATESLVDPAPAPDATAEARESLGHVARALETIPLARRAVFILHVIDEASVPEVAESLEIPLNTAYSRLRVAREEFAAAMHRLTSNRSAP